MKPTVKDAYDFFHEGTLALAQVEANGIRIDTKYLKRKTKEVQGTIAGIESEIKKDEIYGRWRRRFGDKTNLESVDQLGAVLNMMGHSSPFKTEKAGKDKWDEAVLSDLDTPFCKEYVRLKKYRKALSTYLLGYQRELCGDRIHPSYNLAGGAEDRRKGGAQSYRGSCSMPNFQNIPVRNKMVKELVRPCFIARDGHHLVEVDFSGIEVRVSACYNKDPTLIKYIKDKSTDMHRDEASVLFMLPEDQINKETLRDSAKNQWVFPQFYGSVWFQCAPAIWRAMERRKFKVGKEGDGIDLREHLRKRGIKSLGDCSQPKEGTKRTMPPRDTFAGHLVECEKKLWHERFPVYTKWKKDFYNKYLERGYFDLYTGFRCRGYYRRNQVINFPVQGAAFHCLLWCVIRINKELKRRKMRSIIVGQIHDSIIGDVHQKELQDYLSICHRVMTQDLPKHWPWIIIPLETEADVSPLGKSWLDKEPYVQVGGKWIPKNKKAG